MPDSPVPPPPTRVAALDVDGTLIKGQSQAYLAAMLTRRGMMRPHRLLQVACSYGLMGLGLPVDQQAIQRQAIGSLRDLPQAQIEALIDRVVEEVIVARVRPGAREEISRLQDEGCRVVLVSAAPFPLISALAARLGIADVVATEIVPSVDGRFSGRVDGLCVLGEEKVRRLQRYADDRFGDWELYAAYGDQAHDASLLGLARRPVAVWPSRGLARIAAEKGWPVLRW